MRSICKQSLGYFRRNKLNVLILCILTFLTSFMYFFVECSIDGNLAWLSTKKQLNNKQNDLLIGLNSNKILALVFLICLTLVSCFIFYMFYKKYFDLNRKNLGCYRALGFTKGQITSIYIAITSVISLAFLLLGLVVGYCYSYILLDTYQVSYNVNNVVRGLSVSSFATGIMVPTVLLCIMTYLASGVYRRVEISKLFTEQGKSNKNLRTMRLFEKVAKILPSKYSFSSKLALRKPFNVFLILVSVYIYLVLIVISISLNMSSSKVYQSQTAFRHYKYEVTFSNAKVDSDSKEKGDQYFLEKKIKLASDNKNIGQQNLVAMDNDGDYFHLVNKRQKIQLSNGEVAINPRIAEIYNIKSGDKVLIKYKNFEKYLIVKAIADNGNTSSIYIKRTYFNKLIGNPANTYNGLWCNKLNDTLSKEQIETYSNYKKELQDNNVSNRVSAIINQVLACIFGVLLIFLVLLLNFQDNTNNFIYLRKLGYLHKEIKNMLINIYLPLILFTFVIMIIPSILTSQQILRMLSLQTGDYMPFISNIYVFLYALVILVFLYLAVIKIFDVKLKNTFNRIDLGEYV